MSRTLSDEDIAALAVAIRQTEHTHCTLGLTADEVSTLKRILRGFDTAASTIGKTVLVAIVGVFLAVISKGFWIGIIEGIRKAG